jgi:hypothetical protein
VSNPMTNGSAATPAGGSRFVGLRRRITNAIGGEVICDECGTSFDGDRCPTCAQRRRRRAGLEVVVETCGNDRRWMTMERSDEADGGGWEPTRVRPHDDDDGQGDDEPGGWPW